jgi:hypothetical protein
LSLCFAPFFVVFVSLSFLCRFVSCFSIEEFAGMRKIMFGVLMALAPLSVAASGAELQIVGTSTSGGTTVVCGHAVGDGHLRIEGHASHGGKTVLSGYADSPSWVWPSDGCYRPCSRPAVNMIAVAKPVATRCGTRYGGHGYAPRVSSAYGAAARASSVQSYGYARSKATAVVHSGHAANAYAESSYHALGARAVAVAETGYFLP